MRDLRAVHANADLDSELLPTGWKRIIVTDPIALSQGDDWIKFRPFYEMTTEIREWCRDQFGYEPVIYAHRQYFGSFNVFYSTVFPNPDHAIVFTLRWL